MSEYTITYLYHSGFAVASADRLLVFDYYVDTANAPVKTLTTGVITARDLERYESVYVFVSHGHGDHFNPSAIYKWASHRRIHYILSDDIDKRYSGIRIGAGMSLDLDGMRISAFESTDLGVAFLVECGGALIFHAGDLNLWHWRDESTPREIETAETEFRASVWSVVSALAGRVIDICFFPLDPRQGRLYDAGAGHFIMQTHPRLFIPMHFQDRDEVVFDFIRRERDKRTRILALTKRGQQYCYVHDGGLEQNQPSL